MGKILINLFVPVLNESFDIYIPTENVMFENLNNICRAVTQLSDGKYFANEYTCLAVRKTGYILDINKSAMELNLHNGSLLMLI